MSGINSLMVTAILMRCPKTFMCGEFEDIFSFCGIEKMNHMVVIFRFQNFFLHLAGGSYGDAKR